MTKLALVLPSPNRKTLPDGALDDRFEIVRLVVLPSSASINARFVRTDDRMDRAMPPGTPALTLETTRR